MKGCFVIVLVVAFTVSAEAQVLDNIFDLSFLNHFDLEALDKPVNWFLFDLIPRILGEKTSKELPDTSEFKEYLMKDVSNEEAAHLTVSEIIERSGFKYKSYDAIADDGYVTRLTRLINPLADKRYLRRPPVLMEHGGTVDPTAYVVASSIQHHPEPWPRMAEDGPITSWNRSLAFVLANNGFDVWLAETRGAGDDNKKYIPGKVTQSVLEGRNRLKNLTKGETFKELSKQHEWQYWDFSLDDIMAHELKSHIDLVLDETGSEKLLMFAYSISTTTTFGFFSIRPDYAEKIQGFVSMAPIVSGEHVNLAVKLVVEQICPASSRLVGTVLLDDIVFTTPVRNLMLGLSKSRYLRYTLVKAFINYAFGGSSRYQTLLDLNVLGHLLRPLSFKEAQQLCQVMKKNKLSKYDYGKVKNLLIYGTEKPPEYKLSEFHIKDWITVTGEYDSFSTQAVNEHLLREVFPKPKATVMAPNFNHGDLYIGLGNDRYVNMPVLRYYQSRSTVPHIGSSGFQNRNQRSRSSRQVELGSIKLSDLDQFKRLLRPPEEAGSDIVADTLAYLQKALFKSADSIGGGQESVAYQFKSNMREFLRGIESLENFGDILKPVSRNKEKESSEIIFD